MKSKLFSLLVLASFFCILLTGCGSDPQSETMELVNELYDQTNVKTEFIAISPADAKNNNIVYLSSADIENPEDYYEHFCVVDREKSIRTAIIANPINKEMSVADYFFIPLERPNSLYTREIITVTIGEGFSEEKFYTAYKVAYTYDNTDGIKLKKMELHPENKEENMPTKLQEEKQHHAIQLLLNSLSELYPTIKKHSLKVGQEQALEPSYSYSVQQFMTMFNNDMKNLDDRYIQMALDSTREKYFGLKHEFIGQVAYKNIYNNDNQAFICLYDDYDYDTGVSAALFITLEDFNDINRINVGDYIKVHADYFGTEQQDSGAFWIYFDHGILAH